MTALTDLKRWCRKDVFQQVQKENRVRKSSAVYQRIAAAIRINACTDTEFQRLTAQLRAWFPAGGAA
ncbi:hypothetical protein [uncultured Lamprocystis sp.]|jgi:hypothetical protein|uniref:hypothetical protein n=1 Tax=uncultured Lamprocystis sp. TaxID=543132 RepID=UPI0025F6F9AC|nr:hypothetical protein [uncultured Lamprocystis sp.]